MEKALSLEHELSHEVGLPMSRVYPCINKVLCVVRSTILEPVTGDGEEKEINKRMIQEPANDREDK